MKPNIVYIYADDLGRGMLSCYGQEHFRTPNIDRLADEGMKFTHAYGTAFCAPARACLITGMHDAHAGRWTFNRAGIYKDVAKGKTTLEHVLEVINNTGIRPAADGQYLASVAKKAGYATGEIGKLEWGFATTGEEIAAHGWDYHYGYYDHQMCHGFFPPFVFENGKKIDVPGNTDPSCGLGKNGPYVDGKIEHPEAARAVYSQDLFDEKIVEFMREHKDQPFLLYHPSQLPHGPIYYPDVYPELRDNPELTDPEKEFASMVIRLDRTVGLVLDTLEELGLTENTLILFASDNGHINCPTQVGRSHARQDLQGNPINNVTNKFTTEACGDVFDGNDGMAGLKTTNWEGGARIPFLAKWPACIEPGSVSSHLISNYDTLATVADVVGVEMWGDTDGISFRPALAGEEDAPEHDYIIYASMYGPAMVTRDGWKLRVVIDRSKAMTFGGFGANISVLKDSVLHQLYYLPDDYREDNNLAKSEPEKVHELRKLLLQECDGNMIHGTPNAHFAFYSDDVNVG